jgi:hypothetical protein
MGSELDEVKRSVEPNSLAAEGEMRKGERTEGIWDGRTYR